MSVCRKKCVFLFLPIIIGALSGYAEEGTGELLPPYDPKYEASSLYVSGLGLIQLEEPAPPITSAVFASPFEPEPTISLPNPIYANIILHSDGTAGLAIDSSLPLEDIRLLMSADIRFRQLIPAPSRIQQFLYQLDLGTFQEWQTGILDIDAVNGFMTFPQDTTQCNLQIQAAYTPFPAPLELQWNTGLFLALLTVSQEVYRPAALKQQIGVHIPDKWYLPVFLLDFSITGEPVSHNLEWITRVSALEAFFLLNDTLHLTVGASFLGGSDYFVFLPEIALHYFRNAQVNLAFTFRSDLEGNGTGNLLLNTLPAETLYYPLDRGFISNLLFQYLPSRFFNIDTSLTFYSGRWNLATEEKITNTELTDMDFMVDMNFNILYTDLFLDLELFLLQGLLFNQNRHIIMGTALLGVKGLPLEIVLNLDWSTAPSVAAKVAAGLKPGSRFRVKGKYTSTEKFIIEGGLEIITDKYLNYLDYNLSFSILFKEE